MRDAQEAEEEEEIPRQPGEHERIKREMILSESGVCIASRARDKMRTAGKRPRRKDVPDVHVDYMCMDDATEVVTLALLVA